MRIFLIICCLAYASGQGYNYQFPAPQTNYLPPAAGHGSQGSPGPQGYSYQTPVAAAGPGGSPVGGAPGGGFQTGGFQAGGFQAGGAPSGGAPSGGAPGGGAPGGGAPGGGAPGGGAPGGGFQTGSFQTGGFQASGAPGGGAPGGGAPGVGAPGGGAPGGGFQTGGFQAGGFQAGAQGGVSSGAQGGFSGGSYTGGNVRTEYVKEFFTYRVDDKDYISINQGNQNSGVVKKNIRVVIIKGPEVSGLEDAAVALSKNINEQKLAIYVLSKQADIEALTKKLSSSDIQINPKPEVHFVKYKTEDDAEKAKEAIHKQYESLDGPSSSQDGGAVPVHTFASKSADTDSAPAPAPAAPAQPAGGYLPSSVV